MTREQKRKEERLDQERKRKFVNPVEQYVDTPLSTATTEHLIGEEMVNDDASASALADRCIAEAERLFASDEGWTKVLEEDGIFVESKDIHGPYLKSGVRVVRGLGAIEADADTFYDFQVRRIPGGNMQGGKGGLNVAIAMARGRLLCRVLPCSERYRTIVLHHRVVWVYPFPGTGSFRHGLVRRIVSGMLSLLSDVI